MQKNDVHSITPDSHIKKGNKKYFSKYQAPVVPVPDLLETQINSFNDFVEKGIGQIFKDFSPIRDYSDKKFELQFLSYTLGEPKSTPSFAKENKMSYEAPIKARVKLINKTTGGEKEQEIFMSDFPLMTANGTFIINGVERVVVQQIIRSSGVYFVLNELRGKRFFGAKVIPAKGVWIEIDSEKDNMVFVRIDKRRRFPVTTLLRVLGFKTDEEILKAFKVKGKEKALEIVKGILEKDPVKTEEEAYVDLYKRLRDGDMASIDVARDFIGAIFSQERYDFSLIGRHRFNNRFHLPTDKASLSTTNFTKEDLVEIVAHIVELNNTPGAKPDDIDNLGFRRVRSVGEIVDQKFRLGMMQIKRNIQDRMSTIDAEVTQPVQVINQRPLQARIKEFFAQHQLSQFMDQENALSELENLRTLVAIGPGGLTRERAGLEVRDVHTSHYGRVCPIHTPEGPNIGLVLHLATYAKINAFGVIETPYVKVEKGRVTGEIVYLNAMDEENAIIAHAATPRDEKGNLTAEEIEARVKTVPGIVSKDKVEYIDVASNQAFSIATSMVPFLEHNDANRALMGSNMQKQAVPCLVPQAPLVATGMEAIVARDSRRMVFAEDAGEVAFVDSTKIVITNKDGKDRTYGLVTFERTNKTSMFRQKPIVNMGDKVKRGDVIADSHTTKGGQAALGQNVKVAFMSWNGNNYEDAIILSERLVKDSVFTSVYVDEYICTVRDTKLGPEQTTRDIPNTSEIRLKDLDEEGIIRIGAEVRENDILVGKITPKGEAELTPEERLLRSIFSEKASDVKDTSLRLPHGSRGRIVGIKIFSREKGHQLESGVLKKVVVEVAQVRTVSVGDKLAGRHGNKGIISRILPVEEMPYMADGTPIDVILTPLGVPSRMNLGQILEIHLGMAAQTLGYQAIVPLFGGATSDEIKGELKEAGLSESGTMKLFDGRTGEAFEQEVAVGFMYMFKLHHMVEDKVHARSIGPYSLITQQPLGGKAQFGGQRFGEMEVWALEGYGAAHTLREMMTIKSDDIIGRSEAFSSIIRGEKLKQPNAPASFNVMLNYLRGLSLDVDLRGGSISFRREDN